MVEKKIIERITEMTSSKTVCRYLYLILLPCLIAFYLNMYWLASAVNTIFASQGFLRSVADVKTQKNFNVTKVLCKN